MSPVLMEALQLFKFMLKKQRLNFISGWATSVAAMTGDSESALASDDDVLDALVKDDGTDLMDKVLTSFYTYDAYDCEP
jgi:hypothetical protein